MDKYTLTRLQERATAEKWARERANEGSYERWLLARAVERADKVRQVARLRLVAKEG